MEELKKKINQIKKPEIELPYFKAALKGRLLKEHQKMEKRFLIAPLLKPALVSLPILIILILGVLILPQQFMEARALKIAKAHPEIQKLIQEYNIRPTDIKLQDQKAYLLFMPEETPENILEVENQKRMLLEIASEKETLKKSEGVLAIVDLQRKNVASIKTIRGREVVPLTSQEEQLVKEVVEKEEVLKEILPSTITIEKIEPALPEKLRLEKKGTEIQIAPPKNFEKRAKILYKSDGKRWMVEVNLQKKKIEKLQLIGNQ